MELNDTHFVTPSGLDDDTDEHYSTAADMAKLAAEAMKMKISGLYATLKRLSCAMETHRMTAG